MSRKWSGTTAESGRRRGEEGSSRAEKGQIPQSEARAAGFCQLSFDDCRARQKNAGERTGQKDRAAPDALRNTPDTRVCFSSDKNGDVCRKSPFSSTGRQKRPPAADGEG